jgi:hypothetical protein
MLRVQVLSVAREAEIETAKLVAARGEHQREVAALREQLREAELAHSQVRAPICPARWMLGFTDGGQTITGNRIRHACARASTTAVKS